jgi:hypothetical protein
MLKDKWERYEGMVLHSKSKEIKDSAFKAFIGGYASAYSEISEMINNPQPDSQQKFLDMGDEIKQITLAVIGKVKK